MKTISLVMIVKNEEEKIERCLSSVKDLVNEIIIVDTGSTDKTKDLALKYGAKIYDYEWDDNFSNARNFALEKSSGNWNLILDADEYVVDFDIDNLREFMNSSFESIGQIKIISFFDQDGEIRNSKAFISRFAPSGIFFKGSIHEQLNSNFVRSLVSITIEHDGYLNTNKFDRNISLLLTELKEKPTDSYLLYQIARTYYSNKMYNEASIYFNIFCNHCNPTNDAFIKDGLVTYLYTVIKTQEFDIGLNIINSCFDLLTDYCDFFFVCGIFFTELVSSNPKKYISYFDNIELSYLSALDVGKLNCYETVSGTGSYLAAYNLGLFYELSGNKNKALEYFSLSYKYGYLKASKYIKTDVF